MTKEQHIKTFHEKENLNLSGKPTEEPNESKEKHLESVHKNIVNSKPITMCSFDLI